MKKVCFFTVFLTFLAVTSFAADDLNGRIFIEGKADNQEHYEFFLDNFTMEAEAFGYTIADSKADAGYTFSFEVLPNLIEYDDGTVEPAPAGEPRFFVQVMPISNSNGTELFRITRPFTETDEITQFIQLMFFQASVYFPDPSSSAGAVAQGSTRTTPGITAGQADTWKNQWLYARASLDVLSFALYHKWFETSLDDTFAYSPRLTLGAEGHFLDWMSAEAILHIGWEHLNTTDILTTEVGLSLKFPFKSIGNVLLEPYATVTYTFPEDLPFNPLKKSGAFNSYSMLGIGLGLQMGIKGFRSTDVMFIDIGITPLYIIGNVNIKNHSTDQRSVISLGAGYKFGFFDR